MYNFRLLIIFLLFIILSNNPVNAYSQNKDIQNQIDRINSLETKLDSLKTDHSRLIVLTDSLAYQINIFRDKVNLNPGEHKKLEKQLRQSQILEQNLRDVKFQIDEISKIHKQAIETLIKLYQTEIERFVQVMEKEEPSRENLFVQFNKLLKQKHTWEAKISPPQLATNPGFEIIAEPEDSKTELRMKGDILADQEGTFRRVIDLVDKRIRSLKEEENIRIKVAELTGEIDIFDEREELLGKMSKNVSSKEAGNGFLEDATRGNWLGVEDFTERNWNVIKKILPSMDNLHADISLPTPSSPSNIHQLIERLRNYRYKLIIYADSLKQRSQWFQLKAEDKKE